MSLLSVIFPELVKVRKRSKHRHYHARGSNFAFRKKKDAQICLERLANYMEMHGYDVERLSKHTWSVNHEEMLLWVDDCDVRECISFDPDVL